MGLRYALVFVAALGASATWTGQTLEPDVSGTNHSLTVEQNDSLIKYVIITAQRSGSTWLRSMLNSHPEINNDGEFGRADGARHVAKAKLQTAAVQRVLNVASNPKEFDEFYGKHWKDVLEFSFAQPANSSVRAVGFKWMLNQHLEENLDTAIKYLNKNQVKVLILDRENALRRAISTYHMRCTDDSAHLHKDSEKSAVGPADIPAKFLRESIKNHLHDEAVFAKLNESLNEKFYVTYEALSAETNDWMLKIYDFLGVSPRLAYTGYLQKIHDGTLDSLIKDWPKKKATLIKDPTIADKMTSWETDNFSSLVSVAENEGIETNSKVASFIQHTQKSFPSICYD